MLGVNSGVGTVRRHHQHRRNKVVGWVDEGKNRPGGVVPRPVFDQADADVARYGYNKRKRL